MLNISTIGPQSFEVTRMKSFLMDNCKFSNFSENLIYITSSTLNVSSSEFSSKLLPLQLIQILDEIAL